MNHEPKPQFSNRALMAMAGDAQAFAVAQEVERRNFILQLLDDQRTEAFSPSIVRWVMTVLQQESEARQRSEAKMRDLSDQMHELRRREPMPKSKAIVKLAKVVARQAEAIDEIQQTINFSINFAGNGAPNDALSAWQKKHADTIEAAKDGD